MSELQLGLIGLGTLGVLAVVVYNKWQERRHQKVAEQVLQRNHTDVLLGADSQAPDPRFIPEENGELPVHHEPQPDLKPARYQEPERMEPVLSDESFDEPQPGMSGMAVDSNDVFQEEMPVTGFAPDRATDGESSAKAGFASVSGNEAMISGAATPPEAVQRANHAAGNDDIPPSLVSPAIDYVASFEFVEAVAGDRILDSQRQFLSRISKPVGWAGYNERTREWEEVVDSGRYKSLRVGLLLADRRGPLGEADLLTFHGAMQNLSEELMAVAELPDRDSALDAALALDQFCADVDIQLGLNVISKGQVFPGTKIRALAEAAGMVLDASGRFVRSDDDGRVLYMLANQESAGFSAEGMKSMSTHGLVFILDVPCVSHGDRVFAQMLDLARRMAETLNGLLVDDNRQPLTEAMLEPFRRQIAQYQSQLAARGLPAGSSLAQRLFN
ncbi:MAG: cell division protein ZipA C-terminal FtsZ-binding domain-containing protein [Zoogloeaceae bacterium]|nr:cell division protein ZipA C-terminal FtsZ-binding domain-containing protein [Zoogloeaceae bacterium]